jgi:hypothetical protein
MQVTKHMADQSICIWELVYRAIKEEK